MRTREEKKITSENLSKLKYFGKENNGWYTDRFRFAIVPKNEQQTKWCLCFISEIDGDLTFIKNLKNMGDLYLTYYVITNEILK